MNDELTERIETALDSTDDELRDALPDLLDDLDGGTREFVRDEPELFGRVVRRMESIDVASFVTANPDVADQFQELLWAGVEVLVENRPDVREQITDDITVNFSATDCPMDGHLVADADAGALTGGAGLLDDPALEITGPADTLVGLVTGTVDPIRGFMQQHYQMDGPVRKGTRLAPIMNTLSENIPS